MHAVIFAAPPASALHHAVTKGWTSDTYLLAIIADREGEAMWQRAGDNSLPHPPPVWRPGDPDPEEPANEMKPAGLVAATVVTVDEFMAMREARAARWRETHGIAPEVDAKEA